MDLKANFKCSQRKIVTLKTLQSIPQPTSAVNSALIVLCELKLPFFPLVLGKRTKMEDVYYR